MLKALVSAGSYTSGNVPLTLNQNTNGKYQLNADSSIDVRVGGLTAIRGNVVVTSIAAGNITLQLYADGVAVPGALDTKTLANGSTYTFHIDDIVRAVNQITPSYATLSLQLSGACTLVGGDVVVTYEK